MYATTKERDEHIRFLGLLERMIGQKFPASIFFSFDQCGYDIGFQAGNWTVVETIKSFFPLSTWSAPEYNGSWSVEGKDGETTLYIYAISPPPPGVKMKSVAFFEKSGEPYDPALYVVE